MISAALSLPNNQEPTWAVEAKIEDLAPCSFSTVVFIPPPHTCDPLKFIQFKCREETQGKSKLGLGAIRVMCHQRLG